MDTLIAENAFLTLFFLSFLAATLIPLGSEWLLVFLVARQYDPLASVLIATAGNTLGACTTYAVGLYGGPWLTENLLRIDTATRQRAEMYYCRYGYWSLLLSWLPFIGDPICLVGGVFRVGFLRFIVLVANGKMFRYAAVAWLTLKATT